MKSLRIDVLGLTFVLVWSSGYVVGSIASSAIAPLTVTLWRFVVATVVLAVIAVRRGESWPDGWREWSRVALAGVPLFAVQFGALYTGMAEGMPASTTSLIACSSPLLVAMIAAVARWERLSVPQWTGIGLGVVGVIVTLSDRVGRPPSAGVLLWTLIGLGGLVAGTTIQGRMRFTAGPAALAASEIAIASVVMAGWAPFGGSLAIPLTTRSLTSFAWVALVAGVGAPLLLFALIRQRGATRASSLLFVVPAVTAFAGWPILHKTVGLTALIGLVIAGAGLWLASHRRSRPVDAAMSTISEHAAVPPAARTLERTPASPTRLLPASDAE